jgi:plasmid stabilization system protein ParE
VKKLVVTLTVAATGDIQDIARYIARDNSNVARKFEDEFWLAGDRICMFPRTGYAIPRPDGTFLLSVSRQDSNVTPLSIGC